MWPELVCELDNSLIIHRNGGPIDPGGKSMSYPDSFYEQSGPGTFGNFGSGIWGYLVSVDMSQKLPYSCVRGGAFASFTPGLPEDVDADGTPK